MTGSPEEGLHAHDLASDVEPHGHDLDRGPAPQEPRAVEAPPWAPAAEAPVAPVQVSEVVPTREAPVARSQAEPSAPEPAAAEQPPAGAVNVPPPITVSERPAKPRRGWWGRLTQG